MALDYYSYDHIEYKMEDEQLEEEDDYIDMEISSFTHFFPLSTTTTLSPPHHAREFEFQMSSSNMEGGGSMTSPADELFYKGKLLPLHLPPRLRMVENLHFSDFYSTPLGTNVSNTPTTTSPFESCNVSPAESCQVSRELNPDEYFHDYANNQDYNHHKGFISDNPKKSWTKKLKTKIKALFGKSGCSYESSTSTSAVSNKQGITKKYPFGEIPRTENEAKEGKNCHRRSFSGAFQGRSSTTKLSSYSSGSSSCSSSSSSSSASSNANGCHDVHILKRSNSAKLEIETSLIQGAIAHCKQSQHALQVRKTLSEIGFESSMFHGDEDGYRDEKQPFSET